MLRTVFLLLTAVALALATGAPLSFSPPSNEAFDIPANVEDIADNASDLSVADTPDNASPRPILETRLRSSRRRAQPRQPRIKPL